MSRELAIALPQASPTDSRHQGVKTLSRPAVVEARKSAGDAVFDTIHQVSTDAVERGIAHLVTDGSALDGRSIEVNERELINFGSCSYLGLERDPVLIEAVQEAAQKYGTQFSSSRSYLSIGQYATLERLLDQIFEKPTIACPSTTLGHMSALPVLVGSRDAVILDQQVHHSVQTAAQLLKARGIPVHLVRHNRMDKLEELVLKLEAKHDAIWYMADGVYSMYGDVAPLQDLVAMLNRRKKMWLYVDDAHGMSWTGPRGSGYVRSQIEHHDRMVQAASLNKSFAAAGGVLVFPNTELRDRVRHCGPTMIFSGPIQPPMLGAAIASARMHLSPAFERTQAELGELIAHTNRRIAELGLPQIGETTTPLFFIPVGLPRIVYKLVKCLLDDGCYVNLGIFPAVPMSQGGLRFTIHRGLKRSDIDYLIERMAHHYPRVLEEEGSSLAAVEIGFRRVGLVRRTPQAAEAPDAIEPAAPRSGLRVRHEASIDRFDPERWNALFGARGAMTHAALAMMERVFANAAEPTQRATPGYVWIEDETGKPVAAAPYSVVLIKEDMFARAEVSKKLEALRQESDPNLLVSKAIVLGTPLSVGEHLFLDRAHPNWEGALERLTDELQGAKTRAQANQILLRDFVADGDPELERKMLALGFFAHRLPDTLKISQLDWADRDEHLSRLGQKYRYNVRREVLAFEDQFELETSKDCADETIRRAYDLYLSVHRRSHALNVFALPFALFEEMFRHPEYDVLRLYMRGDDGERELTAVLVSHHSQDRYSALLVGLDDTRLQTHNTYKQVLFRCVERARALGAQELDLGFTADLEKKKLGARPVATRAYVQQDDDYAAIVMETL